MHTIKIYNYQLANVFLQVLALVFLQGCSNNISTAEKTTSHLKKEKVFVYDCEEKFSFSTKMEDEQIWLFLPDKTISLPHVTSASGALYSNGSIVFWDRGDQARLELGKTIYQQCQINQTKSVWEAAKLKGIDYRAIGSEPNWSLEIKDYARITFVTAYGKKKFTFKTPQSSIDYIAKKTVYKTRTNEHAIEVLLVGKPCTDSSSGEFFDITVYVGMDGLGYQGCGKALQ